MDTFRVYSRCRPLNELELNYGAARKAVSILDPGTICINDGNAKEHIFQLDGAFDEITSNSTIFSQAVIPLIDNVIYGINSTVFAYGITGAGKSFTMFGGGRPNEQQNAIDRRQVSGLIPLTFDYLINMCANQQETKLRVSYLEIYNEQVFDLLQPHQQNLQLSEDPIQGCVVVQDLTELELHSIEQAQSLISIGNSRRVVAETKANQVSSRSHAIVIISIQRRINESDQFYSAKLSLVDLAGSQKQSVHSETRGIRTFQGSNINRSLLTLGNCINILSEKRKNNSPATTQFIPYRDSKLTRLLKDSLGGNTKTVMIACVSPSYLYYEETLNTLKYACRANKIEKVVQQNIRESKTLDQYKKQINLLKKENELLKMNQQTSPTTTWSEQSKNYIAEALERLTKIIQSRVVLMAMSGSEERMESIEKIVKTEEQIKLRILDQFTNKSTKKATGLKQQNTVQNQFKKKINNSKGAGEVPTKIEDPNKIKNQQRISLSSRIQSKPNYSQYKLSLKEQLKNEVAAQNRNKNYTLINLQNLRRKVMEDKKQISNFKLEMIEGRLSSQETRAKAAKLLRMGQESTLRLNQEEIQYLRKVERGEIESPFNENFLLTKKKFISLDNQPCNLEPHPFALNIVQQNGGENSRNRHLKSLNRIISMARGGPVLNEQPTCTPSYNLYDFDEYQGHKNWGTRSEFEERSEKMQEQGNYEVLFQGSVGQGENQEFGVYNNCQLEQQLQYF